MALTIVPYVEEHAAAVAAFNERAKAHDAPFTLSESPVAAWLPKRSDSPVFREFFLALDGQEVRGGFTLRRQDFWLHGKQIAAANYQGPLSEGLWDRRYMMAGVQMLRAALREQPFLYALGMGGREQPLPKLLASAGWAIAEVPFRFTVLNAAKFLRHIAPLRRTRTRALALDLAATSGIGAFTIHAAQRSRKKSLRTNTATSEQAVEFGPWADEIWATARGGCAFTAVRDRRAMNAIFGDGNEKNIVLRCMRTSRDVGWVVVRSTAMKDDKYFGNMRVGSIVDALAVPGEEAIVVALAVAHLRELHSDIVVTNQTHARWLTALTDNGFFAGPSNFLFAASPDLAKQLGSLDEAFSRIHFNRADGDGPIHL